MDRCASPISVVRDCVALGVPAALSVISADLNNNPKFAVNLSRLIFAAIFKGVLHFNVLLRNYITLSHIIGTLYYSQIYRYMRKFKVNVVMKMIKTSMFVY